MKRLFIILILLTPTGCAISHKATQQTTPIRIINVGVLFDTSYDNNDRKKALSVIDNVSQDWITTFGIALNVVSQADITWTSYWGYEQALEQAIAASDQLTDHDIVIAFYKRNATEYLVDTGVAGWLACIDDIWRSHVILKSLSKYDLSHELAHAFVFSQAHYGSGLLAPFQIQLVPFVPIYLRSGTITQVVYDEIMANKWRNFSMEVHPDI